MHVYLMGHFTQMDIFQVVTISFGRCPLNASVGQIILPFNNVKPLWQGFNSVNPRTVFLNQENSVCTVRHFVLFLYFMAP